MTVEFWRMGVTPAPVGRMGELAKQIEAWGWTGLAIPEGAAVAPDTYVCAALAASATDRLLIGTATSVPVRHPLYAANAMATVQAISGGRAKFTLARGDGALLQLGRRPMPVNEFQGYLDNVRAYLRREDVDLDGYPSNARKLFMMDTSLDVAPPPVYVAASGPRMMGVAVLQGDGVNFSVGADAERLRGCVSRAREIADSNGMDGSSIPMGCFVQMAVTADADRESARRTIAGLVMTHSHFLAYHGNALPGLSADDASQAKLAAGVMNEIYQSSWKAGDAVGFYPGQTLDDSFIDRYAIVGTAAECAERLSEIAAIGFDRVLIGTRSAGTDLDERNSALIAQTVLPLVKAG